MTTVKNMLDQIQTDREKACLHFARTLDGWKKPSVLLTHEEIRSQTEALPAQVKDDVQFQYDRVRDFARAQLESLHSFETELFPGLVSGQRVIPIQTAGCYVPGGRFSHVSSAIMTVATAKTAGVEHVIATSPPQAGTDQIHPATLYAMQLAGADEILCLGGVQGIGALAYGCFTGQEADVIVGPGNKFVAQAKHQLYGQVGIDMFAGPTEVMILADHSADPSLVANDMVGQMEHGTESPAWMISTCEKVAQKVCELIPGLCKQLPDDTALQAWENFAEVIVVDSAEEMARLSDLYAAEHLQVQTQDLDWWLQRLKNYGSLFLGEETQTTFGDKCSGTNHVLPTKRVARYSGGLSVDKFVKKVTYQRMTKEANKEIALRASRISRLEGMEAHARSCDVRLEKYGFSDTTTTSSSSPTADTFSRDFSQPEPLPRAAIDRARQVMEGGRLFRYQGQCSGCCALALTTECACGYDEATRLEREFATSVGRKFAMAVNSCGTGMALALRAVGVQPGDHVLVNAFTLTPVPSSIVHVGAVPVFVEITQNLHIDLEDLRAKARATGAGWLLLSHMRGHVTNMHELMEMCREEKIRVIEDCAHTLGSSWDGTPVGSFGEVACYSTQTNKLLNSGEGGLLTTNNPEVAAKVILNSGSYGLFANSGATTMADEPLPLSVLNEFHNSVPNFSTRMTNVTAALIRPQLHAVAPRVEAFNRHWGILAHGLRQHPLVRLPERDEREGMVASSIQFSVPSFDPLRMDKFIGLCKARGVPLAWFGRQQWLGFTSTATHWEYANQSKPSLPQTEEVLRCLVDLPLYHTSPWADKDFEQIAAVLCRALDDAASSQ